jgi:hypothetical protein
LRVPGVQGRLAGWLAGCCEYLAPAGRLAAPSR